MGLQCCCCWGCLGMACGWKGNVMVKREKTEGERRWRGGGGGSKRKEKGRGASSPLKRAAFRARVFFLYFFLVFQNCFPFFLCVLKATIYRQNVVWASKLVPQLFFLDFCCFSLFLDFSETLSKHESKIG